MLYSNINDPITIIWFWNLLLSLPFRMNFLSYSIPLVLVPLELLLCSIHSFLHVPSIYLYLVFFFLFSFSFVLCHSIASPQWKWIMYGYSLVLRHVHVIQKNGQAAKKEKKKLNNIRRLKRIIIWIEGENSYCYFSDGLVQFDWRRIINGNSISSYRWAENRWCFVPRKSSSRSICRFYAQKTMRIRIYVHQALSE